MVECGRVKLFCQLRLDGSGSVENSTKFFFSVGKLFRLWRC